MSKSWNILLICFSLFSLFVEMVPSDVLVAFINEEIQILSFFSFTVDETHKGFVSSHTCLFHAKFSLGPFKAMH